MFEWPVIHINGELVEQKMIRITMIQAAIIYFIQIELPRIGSVSLVIVPTTANAHRLHLPKRQSLKRI